MKATNELMAMTIDGVAVVGTLDMRQDWIDVSVMTETRPDPSWSDVDAAGHFHAWADDETLPTLNAVSVNQPCGGGCGQDECEGFYTDEYHCVICDEQVYPRWIVNTNPPRRTVPGRTSWIAKVSTLIGCGETVSIVAGPYLGIGRSVEVSADSDGVTSTLVCGPMARRLTPTDHTSALASGQGLSADRPTTPSPP